MNVGYLIIEGVTSLVRNSPKLLTFYAHTRKLFNVTGADMIVLDFNASLQKQFQNRKLFNAGRFCLKKAQSQNDDYDFLLQADYMLHQQDADLVKLF